MGHIIEMTANFLPIEVPVFAKMSPNITPTDHAALILGQNPL